MTKYIFVTGGVVSSLGKGITAASLGRLLKSRGFKVTLQKLDPYLQNVHSDPNPSQFLHHHQLRKLRHVARGSYWWGQRSDTGLIFEGLL